MTNITIEIKDNPLKLRRGRKWLKPTGAFSHGIEELTMCKEATEKKTYIPYDNRPDEKAIQKREKTLSKIQKKKEREEKARLDPKTLEKIEREKSAIAKIQDGDFCEPLQGYKALGGNSFYESRVIPYVNRVKYICSDEMKWVRTQVDMKRGLLLITGTPNGKSEDIILAGIDVKRFKLQETSTLKAVINTLSPKEKNNLTNYHTPEWMF